MKYWEITDRYAQRAGLTASPSIYQARISFLRRCTPRRKRFIFKADDLLTAFLWLERDALAPKSAYVPLPLIRVFGKKSSTPANIVAHPSGRINLNRAR